MNERKPNRLPGYDYSQDGAYFFTSVVKGRIPCLGEIRDGVMHPNKYGEIANRQWHWLAEQYPYVRLHAFVVMPDHVHGILEIDRSMIDPQVRTGRDLSLHHPAIRHFAATNYLRPVTKEKVRIFQPAKP